MPPTADNENNEFSDQTEFEELVETMKQQQSALEKPEMVSVGTNTEPQTSINLKALSASRQSTPTSKTGTSSLLSENSFDQSSNSINLSADSSRLRRSRLSRQDATREESSSEDESRNVSIQAFRALKSRLEQIERVIKHLPKMPEPMIEE